MIENISVYLIRGLAALIAIMFHEISHGLAALALGDTTAKERGRLSLNPVKHIDWLGLIMLVVVQFGWAKPVPVDMRYFKKPRRDMAIVALAGPVSNFFIALISVVILALLTLMNSPNLLRKFFETLMVINIGLGVFNLFPIPPLDGSKLLGLVLPEHIHFKILRYERYCMLALILLLWSGLFDKPLGFLRGIVIDWYLVVGNALYSALYPLIGR